MFFCTVSNEIMYHVLLHNISIDTSNNELCISKLINSLLQCSLTRMAKLLLSALVYAKHRFLPLRRLSA